MRLLRWIVPVVLALGLIACGPPRKSVFPPAVSIQQLQVQPSGAWHLTVRIQNNGEETVQLRTRHWKITDGYGRVQEVHGPGVVGEQPVLRPGEVFEYTSGTPLPTPSGFMAGTYSMQGSDGRMFDVEIPAFSLDSAAPPRKLN